MHQSEIDCLFQKADRFLSKDTFKKEKNNIKKFI